MPRSKRKKETWNECGSKKGIQSQHEKTMLKRRGKIKGKGRVKLRALQV